MYSVMTSSLRTATLAAALTALVLTTHADTLTGRVVSVADGDTITVLDTNKQQHKVRLVGIDAPEKGQAFGQKSKENLSDLVFGKEVEIEHEKLDRYGRILGKVHVDGIDVGLQQVRDGMAWHFKRYQSEQSAEDREAYGEAEVVARRDGVGLWIDAEPTPPWAFRRRR